MANTYTDRPSYGAEYLASVSIAAEKRERARDIRPLQRLAPYLWRHRLDLIGAGVFLPRPRASSCHWRFVESSTMASSLVTKPRLIAHSSALVSLRC
jgi:hypothetical protein